MVALLLAIWCAEASSYPRLEAGFNLASLATDPFDYVATDVRVKLILPDGTTNSLPAFFDGGTTWRMRHTPLTNGTYSIAGVTLKGATISVTGLTPASWNVTGPTYGAGYVRLDPANPRRFITSNGRRPLLRQQKSGMAQGGGFRHLRSECRAALGYHRHRRGTERHRVSNW